MGLSEKTAHCPWCISSSWFYMGHIESFSSSWFYTQVRDSIWVFSLKYRCILLGEYTHSIASLKFVMILGLLMNAWGCVFISAPSLPLFSKRVCNFFFGLITCDHFRPPPPLLSKCAFMWRDSSKSFIRAVPNWIQSATRVVPNQSGPKDEWLRRITADWIQSATRVR